MPCHYYVKCIPNVGKFPLNSSSVMSDSESESGGVSPGVTGLVGGGDGDARGDGDAGGDGEL